MKRITFAMLFTLVLGIVASSCTTTRSSARGGCKMTSGMVGYR